MPIFGSGNKLKELERVNAELLEEIRQLKSRNFTSGSMSLSMKITSMPGIREMVLKVNDSGKITYANSVFIKAAGLKKKDVVGKDIAEIDAFEWGPGILTHIISEVNEKEAEKEIERNYQDPETGKPVYLQLKGLKIHKGVQIIIEDISSLRRIENNFGRFLAPSVIDKISELGDRAFMPEKRELTVLFADLRGFTGVCLKHTPDKVHSMLNLFFEAMSEIAETHEATIDKFVGDQIMLFFGAPIWKVDNAVQALNAAIEMRDRHEEVKTEWDKLGLPQLDLGDRCQLRRPDRGMRRVGPADGLYRARSSCQPGSKTLQFSARRPDTGLAELL